MRAVPPIQCTWQGIPLQVIRISDESGRNWVETAYPGRDGVEVEDMGKGPDRFQVECLFNGPTWYAELLMFRNTASNPLLMNSIFVHPFWGTYEGVLQNLRVEHEDKKEDQARVSFTFIESTLAPMVFSASATLASAVAAAQNASAAASAAVAALP